MGKGDGPLLAVYSSSSFAAACLSLGLLVVLRHRAASHRSFICNELITQNDHGDDVSTTTSSAIPTPNRILGRPESPTSNNNTSCLVNVESVLEFVAPTLGLRNLLGLRLVSKQFAAYLQTSIAYRTVFNDAVDGEASDNTLIQLSIRCPHLQRIIISSCSKVSDSGVLSLSLLGELKHLRLSDQPHVTDTSLSSILNERLLSLSLSNLRNVSELCLRRATNLESLAMERLKMMVNLCCIGCCSGIPTRPRRAPNNGFWPGA